MKVLFVTGCPRSGTSFYSMQIFQNVDGFYVSQNNYEPQFLHDLQYDYLSGNKSIDYFNSEFMKYIYEQINEFKDNWIVIKQPYFSYVLNEIYSLPVVKKILLTKRPFQEIFESRMNFKNSLSQIINPYESTWIYLYGLDLKKEWDNSSYEERMKIYVKKQQEIEEKHEEICMSINYGENLIKNQKICQELNLNENQIMQLNKNFHTYWKDGGYENYRLTNKEEAQKYLSEIILKQEEELNLLQNDIE